MSIEIVGCFKILNTWVPNYFYVYFFGSSFGGVRVRKVYQLETRAYFWRMYKSFGECDLTVLRRFLENNWFSKVSSHSPGCSSFSG